LKIPEVPGFIYYLWNWFLELRNGSAISYQEIKAWSDLKGIDIDPVEVDIIKALDNEQWKMSQS
jgi:hypothetical protein